ncbi:MAG: DUF1538 domain-containing protein [Woeseiaceae bacterium]|nr:DUF1538 domain-containing protein [Woeseiaceae bacterium]
MRDVLVNFWRHLSGSVRDLTPIVLVIGGFQFLVLRQPLDGAAELVIGALFVVAGLTLFIYGLELALFPIGESLAASLARKGSAFWLITFAFLLGFGTTVAEPALTAVASEAANVAANAGSIADTDAARANYTLGLRVTVALSVGVALVLGVLRILFAWSLPMMIIGGYVIVVVLTALAPDAIVGIAFDSGGVTTSTVTVPLVTALGVGLASSIRDRNPMTDGFGLIAFASLTPIIFVMAYGGITAWL